MAALRLLFLALALSASTEAWAHSPYQDERARLRLDDGRELSVRAHWGDGIIAADPVMAVAVIDDGTRYGAPVAVGPISDRGRIGVRCEAVENCFVDYLGIGVGPERTFRLIPDVLQNAVTVPAGWEWCVDHGDCPVSGFEEVSPPLVTLEPLSGPSVALSALKLAPLLLAILFIGLSGAGRTTPLGRVLGWISLAIGGLLALLSLIWVPYFYLADHVTPFAIDIALVILVAVVVTQLRGKIRAPERSTNPG